MSHLDTPSWTRLHSHTLRIEHTPAERPATALTPSPSTPTMPQLKPPRPLRLRAFLPAQPKGPRRILLRLFVGIRQLTKASGPPGRYRANKNSGGI